MVAAEFLRHLRRHSSITNAASDVVMSAAACDAFSYNSHLQTSLQFGDAVTSLSRFATVPAALSSDELSGCPAWLSALRSVSPPCILPCVNLCCYASHAATLPPFQPANPLSLSLQSVAVSRSVCGFSCFCAAHRCNYHTRSLIGNCGATFVAQ